jgi:hypothetical protein
MSNEITDLLREQLERSSRERDLLQKRVVESLDHQGEQHNASIIVLGDRMERAMSAYPTAMTDLGDRLERSLTSSTEAIRADVRHTSRVFGGLLIVAILVIAAVAGVGVQYSTPGTSLDLSPGKIPASTVPPEPSSSSPALQMDATSSVSVVR